MQIVSIHHPNLMGPPQMIDSGMIEKAIPLLDCFQTFFWPFSQRFRTISHGFRSVFGLFSNRFQSVFGLFRIGFGSFSDRLRTTIFSVSKIPISIGQGWSPTRAICRPSPYSKIEQQRTKKMETKTKKKQLKQTKTKTKKEKSTYGEKY